MDNNLRPDVTEIEISTTDIKISYQISAIFPRLIHLTLHCGKNMTFLNTKYQLFGAYLKTLTLKGNYFNEIKPYTFLRLDTNNKLESLDYSANLLEQLHESNFVGLFSLKHLNLQQNRIQNLRYDICTTLPKLEILWMQYNQIEEISIFFCSNHNKLKEINLSYNKLLMLPEVKFNSIMIKNLVNVSQIDQRINERMKMLESIHKKARTVEIERNDNMKKN